MRRTTGSDVARDLSETPDDRIGRLRLFAGMKSPQVREIVGQIGGAVRQFKKGTTIVHEGTEAKWLVPVLSGVVSVYEPGANGERHLVRTVEAGQLFGATLVTTRLEYYPGMAVAALDCEVVFFDMAKIRELWYDAGYRKFFENLYTAVSEYVLYCWRKLSIMACKTTEDKFMMYLNWYASEVGSNDVTLPFARMEDCATFLGVARTSLSPAIGRLVASGEIAQPARGRFVLCRGKRALMEPSEMSNLRHTVCVEFAIMPQASNKVSNERRRAAVPQVARTSKARCGKEGN